MKLAVIGGGYLEQTDHFHINQRLIELTGKQSPRVLFIPTASNDDEGYIKEFRETFEKQLGCDVHILCCIKESYSEDTISEMIHFADFIYLGGGNYINMLENWKENKIDEKLIAALHNGTFIAGYSSGAMCWFTTGFRSNYKGDGYIESDGWNMVNKHFCPHYNQPDRATAFHLFLQNHACDIDGIALEDNCALYITENSFEIIGDPEKAWEFYMNDGKLIRHHFDVTLKSYL
ncbi:peptidase S51 family protein [Bacillus pseudomycoides]|uniref:Type 1 glutamine amidotransferase-like domain-containing protein n=1 Tax=Bacillus TaxID=1386 RepID=UPI0003605F4A|nr:MULTISPECIES: Type 1 glutamine amidotransferase-like domain-containing protein [Bacillus]AIK37335.1 peptidase S51 family protein [Bacillus pseudomycoides]AJI15143.1 peptidase S51 family protein [Bacillus pseudomycoides]MEB3055731.1 Type 1 glutamine amidotransferase-like domain-containing protein [Bacillus pseudomycoides]